MADKGTRNTAIAFGDYEIAVTMKKASGSRDLKTEYVNRDGKKVTGAARGGGGSTKDRPGVSKAVRLAGDQVVRLPADELESIEETSKEKHATMQVLETIDYRQVPTERIVGGYWLQPARGTARGLRLLAEGLRETGRVAVVKWCSSSREKLGVIRVRSVGAGATPSEPHQMALLLSELTFANDFLPADEDACAINDAEVSEQGIANAARMVKAFARKNGERRIDTASDEAVDARRALLERLCDEKADDELVASIDRQTGEVRA